MTAKLTDRELIELAKEELPTEQFDVWLWFHYGGLGRVTGPRMLEITESAWRHRLDKAERKMRKVTRERRAA